jgi:signal transduction histidine kinase
MPLLRRPPGATRSAPVIVLLLLTLALTAVMAFQAQSAAHSHRAAAEGALRDYASFAAFLYRQNGRTGLMRSAGWLLNNFEGVSPTADGPLPTVREVLARPPAYPCPICPRLDSVRYFWRLDLRDRSMTTDASEAPPPELAAWLADTIARRAHVGGVEPQFEFALLVRPVAGRDRALAYLLRRDPAGRPRAAYGFEASPTVLAKASFAPVFGTAGVLPPSLTGGQPPDSILTLEVLAPDGSSVWSSPRRYHSTVAATDTMGETFGSLRVRVSLRDEAADRLVIGGLPRSRMGFLAALLVLSAALTAVALVQLRRERELARLRADFVSSVSHELRTPLAQIRMFAETLRLGRVRSEAERTRSVEIIDQEARRLGTLVDNVLQFSRAERRQVRLSPEPADLGPLVRDALETFAPLAAARKVSLREEIDDGVWASVDRGAFRQMLLNLLDNAVKYGPPGQTVEVGLARAAGRARVWVRDQGPGIPPRERERVFAPFVRLERDAGSAVAGSGIGLAVVAQLAAAQGGRVAVEDAPGGGARFTVDLPALADRPSKRDEGGLVGSPAEAAREGAR